MTVTPIFPNESDGAPSEELFNVSMEQSRQSKISNCTEKLYSDNPELRKIVNTEIIRHFIFVLSQEIILNKLNVHWDDVVGLEECKTAVKEAVVYPLKYPIFFEGPFSPWKGILLYGPPGTGKILVFLSFLYVFRRNLQNREDDVGEGSRDRMPLHLF